jgi:hypothetical protein
MPKKPKVYPHEVCDKIDKIIPSQIIQAMEELGWNAFGVYEVVREALSEYNKNKPKKN